LTVIVNPSGTPSIVYSEEGTTIDSLTAAGTNQSTAAPIVRYSKLTVVILSQDGLNAGGVTLPTDSEVGDVVECHAVNAVVIYPPSGASLNGSTSNTVVIGNASFRLVAADTWYSI
jgi:hypothetical protein